MKTLRVCIVIELVLGAVWTLVLIRSGLYVTGIFVFVIGAIGLLSVWTFLLGYLGVHQSGEALHRLLHKAQLASSTPGLPCCPPSNVE